MPLCLRDRLLRHDDDVPGFEFRTLGDERAEVVALPDLGQTLDGSDRDHLGRPKMRTPACALYRLFRFTITAVRPSSVRALASGPASSARPATTVAASASASAFAASSSPQTRASSSAGSLPMFEAAIECRPA